MSGASASERISTGRDGEHNDGAMGRSTAAVGGASASERISTVGEHGNGAMGSSTGAVGGASASERISKGWHDDGARGRSAQQTLLLCSACGREVWSLGGVVNGRQDMVGCNSHEGGWMDGWMDESKIQSRLLMRI